MLKKRKALEKLRAEREKQRITTRKASDIDILFLIEVANSIGTSTLVATSI